MSQDQPIKNVVLLMAMEAEAKVFLDDYQLKEVTINSFKNIPCRAFQGEIHVNLHEEIKANLTVVINGKDRHHDVDCVGTNGATLAAFVAINEFKPDLLLNAGTCGGFKRVGAAIGDAFISTSFKNHDRRIQIPGFVEYGRGAIESTPTPNLIKALGYKSGVVTTGNSLDHVEADDQIMLENDAAVKEMEGAAIAWVAGFQQVPFFALKVVTDIVDGDRPTHEEFLENLHSAAVSLHKELPRVLEFVIGKQLHEL